MEKITITNFQELVNKQDLPKSFHEDYNDLETLLELELIGIDDDADEFAELFLKKLNAHFEDKKGKEGSVSDSVQDEILQDAKLLERIKNDTVYQQIISESGGGVMYNEKNTYEGDHLLEWWDQMTDAGRENAGGIVKGAMDFLREQEKKVTKKATKKETKKKDSLLDFPNARTFMPRHQLHYMQSLIDEGGDSKAEALSMLENVEKMLEKIPTTENEEKIVYAHYFHGSSDWFILDYDESKEVFFGFAILNGDAEMAELGYISKEELTQSRHRIELDFYWEPKSLELAKHNAHPDYFPKPETSSKSKALRLKAKAQKQRVRVLALAAGSDLGSVTHPDQLSLFE